MAEESDTKIVFSTSALIGFDSPPNRIQFGGEKGEAIGWIEFKDGKMEFGGDLAGSAKGFFEYIKPDIDNYMRWWCQKS